MTVYHRNKNSFLNYFPDLTRTDKNDVWIMNPLSNTAVRRSTLLASLQFDLPELAQNQSTLDKVRIAAFCHYIRSEYQQITAALTKLLSVSTADFCEKGVKVLDFIKTKHRSRVHPEAGLGTSCNDFEATYLPAPQSEVGLMNMWIIH